MKKTAIGTRAVAAQPLERVAIVIGDHDTRVQNSLLCSTRMGRVALAACVVLLAGCLQSTSQQCANGLVCPGATICDNVHGLCLIEEQREVCRDVADGVPCLAGPLRGICDLGVCVPRTCGNGVAELGEACDDGNTESGDGCQEDCRKIEVCGDSIVDTNEACDDSNANASDGCDACSATRWTALPVIGGTPNATTVGLGYPYQIAVDRHGSLFIADSTSNRVLRIDPNGVAFPFAGTGESGFGGDGGQATSAKMINPRGVAIDGLGNVYIADVSGHIRMVDANGIITTIAGSGFVGVDADNIPAVTAYIQPGAVAVDGLGNVLFIDGNRIRRVSTDGIITTVAGATMSGSTGDGGLATSALLYYPNGLRFESGALYIADTSNQRIRKVDAAGIITTVAGTGTPGFSGDTGAATSAQFRNPTDIAFDSAGRMLIADSLNFRVRRVENGTITTVAGVGTAGSSGDGGPALAAQFRLDSIASDGTMLYINDRVNLFIRRVDATGTITTYAGNGQSGYHGERQAAISPKLGHVYGIARDAAGNLYLTDIDNDVVRKVDKSGVITTVAGTGQAGFSGDGGPATQARLDDPYDVDVDANGNIYIADLQNNRVRRVDTTGTITTVAGNGNSGYGGDGVLATTTSVYAPFGIAADSLGNLYIADTYNNRVRKVSSTGIITTVAGTGSSGSSGDGGPAASAQLSGPAGVTVDAQDVLYIADTNNSRVRRVDSTGTITTVAGTGAYGFSGDGGLATAAQIDSIARVAFAPNGDMLIADTSNQRIRRVDGNGVISTIAGTGNANFDGDGLVPTAAVLADPGEVIADSNGRIYIADTSNERVRVIDGGKIFTIAGKAGPEEMGPLATARLADPRAFVIGSAFTVFAGGGSGTVQVARKTPAWLETVAGRYPQVSDSTDGARFRSASFGNAEGVAFDEAAGVIYFSEGNRIHAVSIVDIANANTWTIATLANAANTWGFLDGTAANARFRRPTGLYLDLATQQLYVADTGNHVIRRIDLGTRMVSTVFGVPETLGLVGDGGPASSALLYGPRALTWCPNGDVYIADTANNRIRRVAAGTKIISTVLGDGVPGSAGEGAPSVSFPVNRPLGLACDKDGNVFVTSTNSVRLIAANAANIVDGTTAVTTIYGAPPRTSFPQDVTRCLTGIQIVDGTTVQVADACAGLLIELRREVQP